MRRFRDIFSVALHYLQGAAGLLFCAWVVYVSYQTGLWMLGAAYLAWNIICTYNDFYTARRMSTLIS